MADSYSALLRLRLQQTGNNNNSWGGLLNSAAIQLIEDSIAGRSSITVAGSDVTLSTANGANDQSRMAIIALQGSPGAARNIIIPSLSKTYVFENNTDAVMTVKTAVAATDVVALAVGALTFVVCDGAAGNVNEIAPQSSATATNALALGGVSANQWARLNLAQTFSKGQRMLPVSLTMGASVTPDMAEGNIFGGELTENTTIEAPANVDASSVQLFEMVIEQAAAGGPYTLTFDPFYSFIEGTPTMPVDPSAIMYVRGVVSAGLGKAICVASVQTGSTVSGLVLSVNEKNVDVWRRLGSPAGIVNVNVTVEAGVVIFSDMTTIPAMDFSTGFAVGSTINLINNGFIIGRGGDGGGASVCTDIASADPFGLSFYRRGRPGGNAIKAPGAGITFNITNADGRIWGGGGGGGSGGASVDGDDQMPCGGAGGGGAGLGRGGPSLYSKANSGSANEALNGTDGGFDLSGASSAGAGSTGSTINGGYAGNGGSGGDFGAAGSSGTAAASHDVNVDNGSGGAAGKAIDLTGASPTFVSGSGSPNVKGSVS